MCGEKYYVTVGKADHEGSPPRMRGKVRAAPLGAGDAGITPAYAGKSQPWRSYSQRRWDHPRVCGEKTYRPSSFRIRAGSPPRVRGKEEVVVYTEPENGITPACAGKSAERGRNAAGNRDHPRVCGEKHPKTSAQRAGSGSPPRVRGKGMSSVSSNPFAGITPACAGKSTHEADSGGRGRDHPRVCGEKSTGV